MPGLIKVIKKQVDYYDGINFHKLLSYTLYKSVYLALFTLTNNFREITKQESIKNIIYKNIVINYNLK